METQLAYGYEWAGSVDRLFITPLTEKCYITMMTAIKLNLGGAPSGPAGTGKTETVKDLASCLGMSTVVINCSDQLDYIAMGKLFKGLAASGSWGVFDEFNRIDIEVLSIVAQQVSSLFKEVGKGSKSMHFEGSDIKLKAGFGIFITMNPGYAGRTELPNNLKELFRPIAMMMPDYNQICEDTLNLFGFAEAGNLARKLASTFKMSAEQLSKQVHYDFGLRGIKSTINTIKRLKEEEPDLEDDALLL
jgi:dynein heavy chain, axonemal